MFERKNRGRRLGRLILAFGLMAGAGLTLNAQAAGPEPSSTVISMQDVDCQSCGMEAVQALEGMKGVEMVSFDRDKAELSVRHRSADVSSDALAAVVRGLGYGAVVGAGKGRYLGNIEFPAELDVSWISRAGEKVDLDEHLVGGKVTVTTLREEVELAVPPGTSSDSVLRLKGQGTGGDDPGDHLVRIIITVPDQPSDELKAALEDL